MTRIVAICLLVGLAIMAWSILGPPAALGGQPPTEPGAPAAAPGQPILTEASVWRTHVTWSKPLLQGEGGLKEARVGGRRLPLQSAPPPEDWMQPGFDDTSWSLWRETHVPGTLVAPAPAGSGDGGPANVPDDGRSTAATAPSVSAIRAAGRNSSQMLTPGLPDAKAGEPNTQAIRVYDAWQYGIQLSAFMAMRCLRGKFHVDEPGEVKNLTLTVAYRGGVVVYLNGQEIAGWHLPRPTPGPAKPDAPGERPDSDGLRLEAAGSGGFADRAYPAEVYPDDVYMNPENKGWRVVSTGQSIPTDPALVRTLNQRIRNLAVSVPVGLLRKGTNVLAVEVHRAPFSEKAPDNMNWSTCGLATIELRGQGAVTPALTRPRGFQVWSASILTKVSPFGSVTAGRIGQGAGVRIYNFPLSWASPEDPIVPIRIVGTRNGVFSGQVVVSSDSAITGCRATLSDLIQSGGDGRIGASACQVCYLTFPDDPPAVLTDPSISLLDSLCEEPPQSVAALAGRPRALVAVSREFAGQAWCDSGAMMAVWLKVRIPADAKPGDYEGTLTVTAEGARPVAVPVKLTVHGFVLPDPRDFVTHVGVVQSPDTLAMKYRVPLWSGRHWALMDRSYSYMGQIGGKVAWICLVADTWLGNGQSLVYWVKKPEGGYSYDLRLLDRYLDVVQKHLRPKAVCVYVCHPARVPNSPPRCQVSLFDPVTGKVSPMEAPAYEPTPEAIEFWRPVLAEVASRLAKRGLPAMNLGLVIEGGDPTLAAAVELFKAACPGARWANLAHYGGSKGQIYGVPFGYVMSVWGNKTPFKSTRWGADDVPLTLIQHNRADPVIDLRPIASRGTQYWAAERAMTVTQGIGPLGIDFWNLTAEETGRRGTARSLEGGVTNLTMSMFSTAAYLAPGPDGPISTARYEIFRQGLQTCEARTVLEKALGDPAARARISDALAERCRQAIRQRTDAFEQFVCAGEHYAEGEGWKWFETSNWQEADGMLFDCAEEVVRALADSPPAE